MQTIPNIDLDELVRQIHILCPQISCNDQERNIQIRNKLHEQLVAQFPQVELEHLDLESIIMKVRTSLADFQRRIDESVTQQQLRRTTRVRKTVERDPAVVHFFNNGLRNERKIFSQTIVQVDDKPPEFNKNNFSDQVSCAELSGLVQIESLPVSASTNLLTIFVPSILQEKLHSCKYKISIDLNRLDLTKKILDLNVEHQVNLNLENELKDAVKSIDGEKIELEEEQPAVVCQSNNVPESGAVLQSEEAQNTSAVDNNREIELKSSNTPPTLEPIVSIVADTAAAKPSVRQKSGVSKRKKAVPPASIGASNKRGRRLGTKNKKKGEKSEIAKYVEMFACNAGSPSSVSQIVTSTTQNWESLPEQNGQIAYFMNGEWTLNVPANNAQPLVSTTNGNLNLEVTTAGGHDTFIPFEDFVNYIENPSLNGENNVIAQVLDGSAETAPNNLNSSLHNSSNSYTTRTLPSRDDENTVSKQQKLSDTVKEKTEVLYNSINRYDNNSSADENTTCVNDGPLDLSKENKNLILSVLDLDQKKPKTIKFSSTAERQDINNRVDDAEKTVIFSTSRNMPSLDHTEVDIFPSPPQRNLDKKVIFRTTPHSSVLSKTQTSVRDLDENSMNDSAIGVDDTSTHHKANDKSEVMKGMSLLEIEKDLNDSMLNSCMDDDMLSLAPSSCFNSPNEDRFADSNEMDVEHSNAKNSYYDQSDFNSSAPRSHLECSFPKLNQEQPSPALTNFKIPRTKPLNSRLQQETLTPNTPSDNCHDTGWLQANISSTDTKSPPFCNTNKIASSATPSMLEISKLFGPLCFEFLADNCFQTTCKFRHQPFELSNIIISLRILQNDALNSAYKFIWRHYKLFKLYFPIFCEEYARRNKRNKLSTMINDCRIQPNCLVYLRSVYTALIATGLNKVNACRFILSRVKERSHLAIDILLEIIIESGSDLFCNVIEEFVQITDYKFRMEDINQLATACLRSGSVDLVTVLIKCLINVDQSQFLTMRSSELIQLLEMVKNGRIDGL